MNDMLYDQIESSMENYTDFIDDIGDDLSIIDHMDSHEYHYCFIHGLEAEN